MMEQAEKRIYLSASGPGLSGMESDIAALLQRGIKVVLLTDKVPES